MASSSNVCRMRSGKQMVAPSTAQLLHLDPATLARCGLAFMALVQAKRKALAGCPGKQPCSWANTSEGTHGCRMEAAESCAWGQARAHS